MPNSWANLAAHEIIKLLSDRCRIDNESLLMSTAEIVEKLLKNTILAVSSQLPNKSTVSSWTSNICMITMMSSLS